MIASPNNTEHRIITRSHVQRLADAASLLMLHRLVEQQAVQAYSLVRSPITMHPFSHLLVQLLSNDHIFTCEIEFSVLVEYEYLFTCWK